MLDTNQVWSLIHFKSDSNKYTNITVENGYSSDLLVNPVNKYIVY